MVQCRAGGGELASLGRGPDTAVEAAIMERVGVSDWWSGGNICPDSPGGCWLMQLITYCTNQSCKRLIKLYNRTEKAPIGPI